MKVLVKALKRAGQLRESWRAKRVLEEAVIVLVETERGLLEAVRVLVGAIIMMREALRVLAEAVRVLVRP
jgi:hypothetical protein